MRFELTTFSLATRHSTTELIPLNGVCGRLYEEGAAIAQAIFITQYILTRVAPPPLWRQSTRSSPVETLIVRTQSDRR